jgi:hypothetical protein
MLIQSVADIPFREHDPFDLLNVTAGAHAGADDGDDWGPDLDYAGFGYARVGELWLSTHDSPEPLPVRNALLLALHTPDDARAHQNDLLLEFWIEPGTCEDVDEDDSQTVTVMLSRFLTVWLPRIASDETAIVLAVCNPHHTRLVRPDGLRSATIHYPLGDVTSWCDEAADFLAGPGALRLLADGWHTV